MQRALLAALLTGLAAPAIGTFLVQRRLALLGDGIGHVAVTGVALGLLTGTSPTWTAVVVAVLGAVLIEVIRERGHTNGDVALALLFYGGLAGGVLITGLAGQGAASLQAYLFGSITSISLQPTCGSPPCWPWWSCVTPRPAPAAVRGRLRTRSSPGSRGCGCACYNLLVAVLAAVTVTVAMRTVGLLLVSALMVVPGGDGAAARPVVPRDAAGAMVLGAIGVGRRAARQRGLSSRATVAPAPRSCCSPWRCSPPPGRSACGCGAAGGSPAPFPSRSTPSTRTGAADHADDEHAHEHGDDCGHPAVPHGDHVDYVHDGHRHAAPRRAL